MSAETAEQVAKALKVRGRWATDGGASPRRPIMAVAGTSGRPAPQSVRYTKWHTGGLAGTSTLLVCRADRIDWAALFNTDADQHRKAPADIIDPLLHKPADEIKNWPDVHLFPRF